MQRVCTPFAYRPIPPDSISDGVFHLDVGDCIQRALLIFIDTTNLFLEFSSSLLARERSHAWPLYLFHTDRADV